MRSLPVSERFHEISPQHSVMCNERKRDETIRPGEAGFGLLSLLADRALLIVVIPN
jgi:hypothetical protein